GAALQALQAGDLFALLAHELFQAGDFAKQFNQQSLKLCTVQIGEIGWRRHIRKESHRVEPGQGKNWALPTFLPLLRWWGVSSGRCCGGSALISSSLTRSGASAGSFTSAP